MTRPLSHPLPTTGGWTNRLDRGCAIKAAAVEIITRTHGPRPVIVKAPEHSYHGELRDTTPEPRMLAIIDRCLTSVGDALAWDRKVSALTRAIAAEQRGLV